jgi:hypothetical protein
VMLFPAAIHSFGPRHSRGQHYKLGPFAICRRDSQDVNSKFLQFCNKSLSASRFQPSAPDWPQSPHRDGFMHNIVPNHFGCSMPAAKGSAMFTSFIDSYVCGSISAGMPTDRRVENFCGARMQLRLDAECDYLAGRSAG